MQDTNWTDVANANIQLHQEAGDSYAELAGAEILLESERTELKAKLIDALIGTDNAKTNRPHSADSAEKAAVVDDRYLKHVGALGKTVVLKNKARTLRDSAYLRTSLAIACIKAEAGVA